MRRALWVSGGLAAGLALGLSVDHAASARSHSGAFRALDVLGEVFGHIQRRYVAPVEPKALIYGAIDGMVATLDPHSEFLPPERFHAFKEASRGRYSGVGMEVGSRGGQLVVIAPIDGTPAAKAGIRPGDVIVAIDGEPAGGQRLAAAVRAIRGPAGSALTLRLLRGEAAPFELTLERAEIHFEPVLSAQLEGGIAYLRLRVFIEGSAEALREALSELASQAPEPLRGLVLDLRNNPGGLLRASVRVADLFLEAGEIVRTEGRGDRALQTWSARPGQLPGRLPLVVIINGGSASASEIVAGALQDRRRGVVIGTRSYGKGSVQSIHPLRDGSGLKLTTARYLTPSGRVIDGKGIEPDVLVPSADELGPITGRPGPTGSDPAVRRAVEILQIAPLLRAGAGGGQR